jgi:hypothetical protein
MALDLKCCYAECLHLYIILRNVVMLSVIMPNVTVPERGLQVVVFAKLAPFIQNSMLCCLMKGCSLLRIHRNLVRDTQGSKGAR